MTKQQWKTYHRRVRVLKREAMQVTMDTLLFGVGFLEIPKNGDPHRIHPKDAIYREKDDA